MSALTSEFAQDPGARPRIANTECATCLQLATMAQARLLQRQHFLEFGRNWSIDPGNFVKRSACFMATSPNSFSNLKRSPDPVAYLLTPTRTTRKITQLQCHLAAGGHDVHDKTFSIHMHARLPPLISINDPGNAAVARLPIAILGSADVPFSKSTCLAPPERIGIAGHAAGERSDICVSGLHFPPDR